MCAPSCPLASLQGVPARGAPALRARLIGALRFRASPARSCKTGPRGAFGEAQLQGPGVEHRSGVDPWLG
eukprot:1303767-Pyramimonas_sp.AAC.1